MKPKTFKLIEMCVEEGSLMGINRAFKHDDNPSQETIIREIQKEICNKIDEWFLFDEGD